MAVASDAADPGVVWLLVIVPCWVSRELSRSLPEDPILQRLRCPGRWPRLALRRFLKNTLDHPRLRDRDTVRRFAADFRPTHYFTPSFASFLSNAFALLVLLLWVLVSFLTFSPPKHLIFLLT